MNKPPAYKFGPLSAQERAALIASAELAPKPAPATNLPTSDACWWCGLEPPTPPDPPPTPPTFDEFIAKHNLKFTITPVPSHHALDFSFSVAILSDIGPLVIGWEADDPTTPTPAQILRSLQYDCSRSLEDDIGSDYIAVTLRRATEVQMWGLLGENFEEFLRCKEES